VLAHYAFEGDLTDESSYNRDLTENNGSEITYSATDNQSNKSGQAAWFNGTNTYAYTDNITVDDNFTIAFWTKPDSSSMSQWDSAFSTGDSTTSGRFQIDYSGSNQIRFNVSGSTLTTDLNADEWNHIVITKTDSTENLTIRMYTDGIEQDNDSQITTLWDKIKVGLNRSDGGYWKGYIDELKIYNRTLTGTEVSTLYESY
jgi:hypothetical protein